MKGDLPMQPMRLVQLATNMEVVRFPDGLQGKAVFSPEFSHIESAMKSIGVPIPTGKKKEFTQLDPGRVCVRLDDPEFGKAFYEVYFPEAMDPSKFEWKKI